MDTYLSFFNLGVELLLEGLEGAPACQEYLFHCQRGYGTDYFTDVRTTYRSGPPIFCTSNLTFLVALCVL